MKWSWMVGRFWGTELHLHISLLLLIPYTLLTFRPTNPGDAVRVLLLITAIFACVGLHEAGHTLAARLYGIEVKSITLWPLGGFAHLSRRPEKTVPNLVIVAAGPLTNLFLGLGFILLALIERLLLRSLALPDLSYWLIRLNVFPFLVGLIIANLSLAIFNLIPIYPLDGGQIARDVLKAVFGEKRADQILIFFSLPLALGVGLLGLVTGDFVLLLTGLILLLTSSTLNARASNMLSMGVLFGMDRGGYYMRKEDYEKAAQEYSRQIERTPERSGLYLNRGMAYLTMQEYDQARCDLEHAIQLDAHNFMAWTLRGELYDLEGNNEQAMACYDKAIELRPDWAISYADRGTLYQKLGNLVQAQADFDRAVNQGHGMAVVHVLRSIFRYQAGDVSGARDDADQAMRYAPQWMLTFPEVFLENFKGQLGWVLDYYNRAVERFPSAYQAYQGRADALRKNERLDWAIEDYHRAIQYAPRLAVLYLNRGLAYQQLGILEKAAADYQMAVKLAEQSFISKRANRLLQALQSPSAVL